MAKRGNGEGSVYRRSSGQWVAVLTLRNGKRKFLYAKTRQEAVRRLNAAIKARDEGMPVAVGRLTVAAFLVDQWLPVARHELRPSTFRRYEEYVRIHAVPEIGRVQLAQLNPAHLQRLYAVRLDAGLSPTTVAHLHTVLHRAFGQAVRMRVIDRNVADLVDPPRRVKPDVTAWDAREVAKVLDTGDTTDLAALWRLALLGGLRRGELLGLMWEDVDLDRGMLAVRRSLIRGNGGTWELGAPKTASGRRTIALDLTSVAALRKHRAAQNAERLRLGGSGRIGA